MRVDFLENERFWKGILWVGILVFLLTRLATLMSFPIFNDEAIYLQYSQLIHDDFGKHRLISAGGNMYSDWKPPLQYWFGSVFFGLADDPLLAGRLASFLISLFGVWGIYLFVKELLGKKAASFSIILYAFCPTALFANNQFIAETLVFSLAPWMYWCFLKALRTDRIRLAYIGGAAAFGALVLLSKQSGSVYLLLSLLLPLAAMESGGQENEERPRNRRDLLIRIAVVAGTIFAALVLRRLALSSESVQLEQRFNGRWLLNIKEIFGLPQAIWGTNWESVRDYYFHYYSPFVFLPILYFLFIAVRRWEPKKTILGLGFLAGSAAVLFLLRGFNEYIYNTAVIVFLVPLLATTFFHAWQATLLRGNGKLAKPHRALGALVLLSFAGLLIHWGYQEALMKVSPADYIRRSTPWARAAYLENWSGGFGVAQAIDHVKAQERPALVLADPQWGNPRTALEVYAADSDDLYVIGLTNDFQTPEGTAVAKAYVLEQPFRTRLVVFSEATNEVRKVWQENVKKYLCADRKEIQVEPTQPPIVICSF